MKNQVIIIVFFLLPTILLSQTVEVLGKLKVSQMDTSNTENHLVVKQADGTLATRLLASLPPPVQDNTRNLQSDLLLTSTLCNCQFLPPAMIQSLLDNKYSLQNLVDFKIPLSNPEIIQVLLANGYSIQDLLDIAITVGDLLIAGVSPMSLYKLGVPVQALYAKTYAGGLIFYLDTLDVYPLFEGLVSATSDIGTGVQWGCYGTLIGGTSTSIGSGQSNTTAIVNGCATAGIAARLCDSYVFGGYDDWFLPSRDEIELMWIRLADTDGNGSSNGIFDPGNPGAFREQWYWSSTEIISIGAYPFSFLYGYGPPDGKDRSYYVRAVRAF